MEIFGKNFGFYSERDKKTLESLRRGMPCSDLHFQRITLL